MSEIVPPEQNSWQEQLELRANTARLIPLNGVEVSKILGSSLAESRSQFDEMYAADTVSDYAYEDETRKIDGALAELAGLQVSSEDTQAEFRSSIGSLAESLKQEQGLQPYGEKYLELSSRRAAVAYLLDQYDEQLVIPQQIVRENVKPGEVRGALIEWTNQTIKSHNARIEGMVGKTIVDNPDMRAAQERISAHYAERARQAQPAGTVDGARQKVAEAFGDTSGKERQALMSEVAQAARGTTRIDTSVPSLYDGLQSSQGSYTGMTDGGFQIFGDGLPPDSWQYKTQILQYESATEAFMSEPDTEVIFKTKVVDVPVSGRFGRVKNIKKSEQVPDGEVPTMVVNPRTGQQELGVKVAYQFNSNDIQYSRDASDGKVPWYLTDIGKFGNKLIVEATLPKSVADKLRQFVARDPNVAREFARTLTLNNGITEQTWNDVVRPPYDQLPSGWEMAVVDMRNNGKLHEVTAQQSVRAAK